MTRLNKEDIETLMGVNLDEERVKMVNDLKQAVGRE